MNKETSWGDVANWYDSHLKDPESYQAKVILPSLIRILGNIKDKKIVDLACGQGFFSRALSKEGAQVTGVDIGKELIAIAEKYGSGKNKINYYSCPSHDIYMLKDETIDICVSILALQNIENIHGTLKEVKRILKKDGKFIFVINHPAFRIPKNSVWGFDEKEKRQYRRIDAYLSESKNKIDMTPGNVKDKKFTISFHRPLQYWSKVLANEGFAIARMEEWISHKKSGKGARENAENTARKEIPLFLMIETVQL